MKPFAPLAFLFLLLLSSWAQAMITVQVAFPASYGKASVSKAVDAGCKQATNCFSQVVGIGGSSFPATGFFACPGHPEVTSNLLIDTVDGLYANYTRDSAYWEFDVNGASASVGASCYFVSDGDTIALVYKGAYTGAPYAPPYHANMQNACINSRRLGWTGSEWPDNCGKESDYSYEKPLTSFLLWGTTTSSSTTTSTTTSSTTLPVPMPSPSPRAESSPSPTQGVIQESAQPPKPVTGLVVANEAGSTSIWKKILLWLGIARA